MISYEEKFSSFMHKTLFPKLSLEQQRFIKDLAFRYRLTFQEFREVVEASRDLRMWGEPSLEQWWQEQLRAGRITAATSKQPFLRLLREHMRRLRSQPRRYAPVPPDERPKHEKKSVVVEQSEKKIHGMCPVASEQYVCCNLRTIDAVENCVFGCSYCTIQTFYAQQFVFDADFADKLRRIEVDPTRRVHFCTGQSSDSLAWGNRHGILDALCRFAAEHPNVLLEFKTKSDNVRYFLETEPPPNIVCSWSLNPDIVIQNEEHFTASLERRLQAARAVADRGIKVSFHFHPMVYFEGWEEAYADIARTLLQRFDAEEILFISFGSMTFIKPVIRKIRERGFPTRVHQMELQPDPHGKLTYPDELKIRMFRTQYQHFAPWHDQVFFYLCMEKRDIWEPSLGYVFPNNAAFEQALLDAAFEKIERRERVEAL